MAQHHSGCHTGGYGSPSVQSGVKVKISFMMTLNFVLLSDNPNLVSRVVVAIETLDQNDNAPELDRQYTTSVCDSISPGQVCGASFFSWIH